MSAAREPPPRRTGGGLALGSPPAPAFYRRPSLEVARDLLGCLLCHRTRDGLVAGRIVEVEAYCGPDDLAAHSARGRRTARNEVMWGPGGRAYVYFVYGMHHCVNVVTARAGMPQAVLIRAAEPVAGADLMRARRGEHVPLEALARGPGNLACAFAIGREHNGADLRQSALRILVPAGPRGPVVHEADVVRSPRIGVAYAGEWAARPWRLSVRDHACVSRPPRCAGRHATHP